MRNLKILLAASLVAQMALATEYKESGKAMNGITSIHNLIFGKSNLLLEPFLPTEAQKAAATKTRTMNSIQDDKRDWNNLVEDIGNFVKTYGKDRDMNDLITSLKAQSAALCNARTVSYMIVKTGFPSANKDAGFDDLDKYKGKIDFAKINFSQLKLAAVDNLSEPIAQLTRDSGRIPSLRKKYDKNSTRSEAVSVLNLLQQTVLATLEKMAKDYAKLEACNPK